MLCGNNQDQLTSNGTGEATSVNEEITWGNVGAPCTLPATTIALGKLRINNIAGTSNGTVIADEQIRVTVPGLFGEKCVYGAAAGVSIGDLTEGNPAILHVNTIVEKTEPVGDTCFFGEQTGRWTATYAITSPANTTLSVSSS